MKKTLNLIGDKEIKIKSFNKTHIRISVLLTILDKGKSLKWLKYGFKNEFSKKNTLLAMDRVWSHFSEEIDNLFKENDANYVLIPPGMTSVLQPLDIYVNKVLNLI